MEEQEQIYEERPKDRIEAIMWDWFSSLNKRLDRLIYFNGIWTGQYSIGTYVLYQEDDEEGQLDGNCKFFDAPEMDDLRA